MNVNGVQNSNYQAYANQIQGANQNQDGNSQGKGKTSGTADDGVIYEVSDEAAKKAADKNTIERLKAEANAQTQQLRDLVEKLIMKQGGKFNESTMWNDIRLGKFEVDEETAAKAKEAISEDGYWGVKQTSERILEFAKALTGGDKSKIEEMRAAFEKGYKAAEKAWGGELPEISKQTFEATMKGFDDWAKE